MFDSTILRAHATAYQRAEYLEAGLEVQTGLEEAIRLIEIQRNSLSNADERRDSATQLLGLRAAHAGVRADLIGFLSDTFRLQPPIAEDVVDIKETSRTLYGMLPGRDSVRDIVHVAELLVTKWARTRPGEDPASPHLRLEAS